MHMPVEIRFLLAFNARTFCSSPDTFTRCLQNCKYRQVAGWCVWGCMYVCIALDIVYMQTANAAYTGNEGLTSNSESAGQKYSDRANVSLKTQIANQTVPV